MNNEPRKPNQSEIDQLVQYRLTLYGDSVNDEERRSEQALAANAYIAVFDQYMTDSPGYTGKLMVVIWPSGPNLGDIFIWREDEMIHVN